MYSSTIKIANLDDYIGPSQECVLPIFDKNQKISLTTDQSASIAAYSKVQQKPNLIQKTAKQTAKISLSDCLACSGCITTAETILQQQQSVEEFLSKAQSAVHTFVGISPQSRASLAHHFEVSEEQIHSALTYFFVEKLKTKNVFDMRFATELVLEQSYQEFKQRNLSKINGPVLSSECPGWACYAEKAQAEFIIDHMSQVKSPQQVMGGLVKRALAKKLGYNPEECLYVSVMPCYDKKVESARREFEKNGLKEVDVVLTTQEIIDLLKHVEQKKVCCSTQSNDGNKSECSKPQPKSMDVEDEEHKQDELNEEQSPCDFFPYNGLEFESTSAIHRNIEDLLFNSTTTNQTLSSILELPSSGSNDYLDYIIRRSASDIYGLNNTEFVIVEIPGKNSDLKEYSLKKSESNENLLSFARIYGLKNIQNLARKIKSKTCKYDYVEIMACPSGCLNGGGQLKPLANEGTASADGSNKAAEIKPKDLVLKLSELINKKPVKASREDNLNISLIISQDEIPTYFQTIFKHIEKTASISSLNW